jgi:hypothetical protein
MGKVGTVPFEQGLSALLGTVSLAQRFVKAENNIQSPRQKLMFDDFGQPDAQS